MISWGCIMNQVKKMGVGIIMAAALFSSASVMAARIATDGPLNFQGYHEVHVDEDFTDAYIDGKSASVTVINDNYVELHGNHIVVSLSKNGSGEWDASWTGKHREHGMLSAGMKPTSKSDAGQLPVCAPDHSQADGPCREE